MNYKINYLAFVVLAVILFNLKWSELPKDGAMLPILLIGSFLITLLPYHISFLIRRFLRYCRRVVYRQIGGYHLSWDKE
jgi:hypothetical protein